MDRIKDIKCPLWMITPNDAKHYFFGYYDLQPYSADKKKHLCHRAAFMDHIPLPDDSVDIGFLETDTGLFQPIAQTQAWNFQQGAMLQWYDGKNILYNIRDNDAYRSALTDIYTGITQKLPLPLATVSMASGYGLSINFSRVYDFRPGYGYAGIKDPYFYDNAPDQDGISLVNLRTGKFRRIIDYKNMAEAFPHAPYTTECKLVVNHISFNPSGDRFIFLLRNFSRAGIPWITMLLSSDLEGNITKLTNFSFLSHYSWKNDSQLLIESDFLGRQGLHVFNVINGDAEFVDAPLMNAQGIHCNYSPNRRYIMGDSYPDSKNYRAVFLHDTVSNKTDILANVYSDPIADGDYRCDLHARWSWDGESVSFDTTHNGRREICELQTGEFLRRP